MTRAELKARVEARKAALTTQETELGGVRDKLAAIRTAIEGIGLVPTLSELRTLLETIRAALR